MVDLTTRLIRSREGYRSRAYVDNDGRYRVGYGSDTWTDADGVVHPVTADTVVSRADADRDLARRIPEFQRQGVISYVGQDAWDALDEGDQAAITDLAYNYGSLAHLPSLVTAIQSGDSDTIADAILDRAGDNGGLNEARRREEANLAAGHPVPLLDVGDDGSQLRAGGTHHVRLGDTLSGIAAQYGVSVEDLARANGISNPNRLQAGRDLVIPGLAPEPASVLGAVHDTRDAAAMRAQTPLVAPTPHARPGGYLRDDPLPAPAPLVPVTPQRLGDRLPQGAMYGVGQLDPSRRTIPPALPAADMTAGSGSAMDPRIDVLLAPRESSLAASGSAVPPAGLSASAVPHGSGVLRTTGPAGIEPLPQGVRPASIDALMAAAEAPAVQPRHLVDPAELEDRNGTPGIPKYIQMVVEVTPQPAAATPGPAATATLENIHDARDAATMRAQSPTAPTPRPKPVFKTVTRLNPAWVQANSTPQVAPRPAGLERTPSQRTSSPGIAAGQATVRTATGKTVSAGATSTAQGGRYTYQVQADGSIKNLTTGRVTAPALG